MAICFKFFIILGLTFNPIFNNYSFAKTSKILIRSKDSNKEQYSDYLIKNTDFVKPNLENILKLNLRYKSNQILNLQNLAETEFLGDDISKSTNTYKKIVSLALNDLWTPEIKQIIFQSYFRLAQLEKGKENYWLEKAIEFSVDSKPDPKLTPMGLAENYTRLIALNLQNESEIVKLNPEISNKYIINSSFIKSGLNKKSIYRLDYIAEGSLPFTTFLSGLNINNFKISELNFTGLCEKIKPSRKTNFTSAQIKQYSNFYVYSSDECEPKSVVTILNASKETSNPKIVNSSKTKLVTTLPQKTIIEDLKNQNTSLSSPSISENQNLSKIKYKKSNKKNTWIYVGSAILAVTLGAMFINQQNDNSRNYESTSRQGF